jgi:hypothetical protein
MTIRLHRKPLRYQFGSLLIDEKDLPMRVEATKDTWNENWRTALVRKQGPMKKGEQGKILSVCVNFYGTYVLVEADDGQRRYLSGNDLKALNQVW